MENTDSHLLTIFEHIDDSFTDHVGPVAFILCEEAKSVWLSELQSRSKSPALRHLPSYIKKLADNIDNNRDKKQFLDQVYQIDALAAFRNLISK